MKQLARRAVEFGSGALVASFGAAQAFAQSVRTDTSIPQVNPTTNQNFTTAASTINTIFRVVTTVAVVIFVLLILVGGIQYLGSFGNEEGTTKAKQLIIDAVVGLFIVLAAGAIAGFVLGQLGIGITF